MEIKIHWGSYGKYISLHIITYRNLISYFKVMLYSSLDCSIWHSFCSSMFRPNTWWGKNLSFTMTARVAGSTHSVLLAMNVILVKECEESNSPIPWKFTFLLDWNFFERLWRHRRKPQPLLIHLTVEKRAKRMPDIKVETTFVCLIIRE